MQQKDVDNHLREDNNAGEGQIVRQLSLGNSIALGDLSFISKEDDVSEDEGN